MMNPTAIQEKTRLQKLTPEQLERNFVETTNQKKPGECITYTPSPDIRIPDIRPLAEYEDMGGVLIAYPGSVSRKSEHIQLPPGGPCAFGIPDELILRMQQLETNHPVHIFILSAGETAWSEIRESLKRTSASLQIEFREELFHLVDWDTDTYWSRDFGPWWMINNSTGFIGIAKHLYTSLGGGSVGLVEGAEFVDPDAQNKDRQGHGIFRPNDDYAADKFSDFLNLPIRQYNKKHPNTPLNVHNWYNTGLLDVGGNYMVTSTGQAASSYLVARQNELPVDRESDTTDFKAGPIGRRMQYIEDQLYRFMGINTYHVLTDPTGTYIGHIDCWAKFLSDQCMLLARLDETEENEQKNQGLNTIRDYMEARGFTVKRIHCPDIQVPESVDPVTHVKSPAQASTAAYTNSLILNNTVYLPLIEGPDNTWDKEAIRTYEEEGFRVTGIVGKPGHPWLGTDALHCRTRAIPRTVVENWLKAVKGDK